ncbi:MAG TPA: hypothetical protein VEQ37_20080 [Actinomycetota bacterium]|nr:hypothetical protein [Actinomycetota bacterium]
MRVPHLVNTGQRRGAETFAEGEWLRTETAAAERCRSRYDIRPSREVTVYEQLIPQRACSLK